MSNGRASRSGCTSALHAPMAAGVSKLLWEIGDIVALVEAEEAKIDRKRGPYKKKILG